MLNVKVRNRTITAALSLLAALSVHDGAAGGRLASASEAPGFPLPAHVDQSTITRRSFTAVFDDGGRLFNAVYNSLDGIGANLSGDPAVSVRFSRVPRPDLPGFLFDPLRTSGPNGQSCVSCHDVPVESGGGGVEDTSVRDPLKAGDPARFIYRNAPHFFGIGAVQRLAEEATAELTAIRAGAIEQAAASGVPVTVDLVTSNGVRYGGITALPSGEVDTSRVQGVFPDLVVRPFTWKGSQPFLRLLVAAGGHNDVGLQPVELFGPDTDFDGDGVSNELSVGDVTALTVYLAAQPRPVTRLELSEEAPEPFAPSSSEVASVERGEGLFSSIGCAACHVPALELKDATFQEPSASPFHRYPALPGGIDPVSIGLDPNDPVAFDLTANRAVCRNGSRRLERVDGDGKCLFQLESNGKGGAIVRLYGDLKLHDMGPALADPVADEVGVPGSMWKTRELWGVGNTGPWLHDGRATTLAEAILFHGGEAQSSRDRFEALSAEERDDVISFLKNLVVFKPAQGPGRVLPHAAWRRR